MLKVDKRNTPVFGIVKNNYNSHPYGLINPVRSCPSLALLHALMVSKVSRSAAGLRKVSEL
jgi:hypothetical protein